MIVLTLVIGLTAGIIVGCGAQNKETTSSQGQGNAESRAVPVETIEASKGEIVNYITVTGTATAVKSAQLTPQIQETVAEVLVEEGEQIKKGEKLIQLDQEDIKAGVAEAQAGLKTAQASLNELLAGTRAAEIERLQAQVAQAKANYQQAKRDYQRYKKLFAKDAVSKQSFESTKTKYISAQNSYKAAQKSLQIAQEGPTKEQINTQRTRVQQAQAQLKTAQLNLAKTSLTAPFDGVVTAVHAEEGEMVGTQPVLNILDLSAIEIETYVSEKNINKLAVGQKVAVNFNALTERLAGQIKNISPALNSQEQGFPLKIEVENEEGLIKSGMYAEVKMETARSKGNLVLPKQALLRENGSSYLFILTDGKAVKKEVKTGLTTVNKVEILSGIESGTKVITQGAERVTDGYEVRVVGGGEQ